MEKQLDPLYAQIAEHLLNMLPGDQWYEIFLHAEVLDDSTNVYFYFKTAENMDFKYSHDIPSEYGVSEEIYDNLLMGLQAKFEELRQIFINNDQEKWTNLTLILKYPGKININYGYEDFLASKITLTQRQMIFEYKHLGLLPSGEKNRKFIEDYVENQG
ncbi:antitoxin YezG family protein [Paenibacillus monticola]|uniref:DUF600 family protein n=1 Tax=Paenibacillus monticola TaxID=2666075 RepID=A0A7X2HBU7_9BACL|nr:antitoxin YezG family protein [Paenibacillus monticola]MRN57150.1 DUF600 family protein [Paenibacillus monticola]